MYLYVIESIRLHLFSEFLSRFVLPFLWGSHNKENKKRQIDTDCVFNSEKNKTNYRVLTFF